jgi:hypothetical protein
MRTLKELEATAQDFMNDLSHLNALERLLTAFYALMETEVKEGMAEEMMQMKAMYLLAVEEESNNE